MENKAFVVTPDIFEKVLKKFLDALKEKDIVESYTINHSERVAIVNFNKEANIPESREDVISKGLFRNAPAILKDLGYEDVESKTELLPMFSTQEENERVIINY